MIQDILMYPVSKESDSSMCLCACLATNTQYFHTSFELNVLVVTPCDAATTLTLCATPKPPSCNPNSKSAIGVFFLSHLIIKIKTTSRLLQFNLVTSQIQSTHFLTRFSSMINMLHHTCLCANTRAVPHLSVLTLAVPSWIQVADTWAQRGGDGVTDLPVTLWNAVVYSIHLLHKVLIQLQGIKRSMWQKSL